MSSFLKHPIGIISVITVIDVIGAVYFFSGSKDSRSETVVVTIRDIVQEVAVTGRVQSATSVELAFEKAGRVSQVQAAVGTRVAPGTLLVSLDRAELFANLAEAEADVKVQEAKLSELKRGTRVEELLIQRLKVQNAQNALEDTKQQVVDTLQDSYTKADDAIRNKVDQVFVDPRTSSPKLRFVTDSQIKIDLENQRKTIEGVLSLWRQSLNVLVRESNLKAGIALAQDDIGEIKEFLDDLAFTLNGATATSSTTQATLDTWKTNVSIARTNVNTAALNTSGVKEDLQTAEATLALEQQNLVLKEAGATTEELAAQEAKLEQVKASVVKIQAQLEKNVLRSPIFGVVTKQDAKKGELVAGAISIVSLISENDFEIETNVPEADIAKIQIGNKANVTLDAYGRDVAFEAEVLQIDPAETIIEGVSTYKVILLFIKEDQRIRSGMTANITIIAQAKEGVLAVPQRAIIRKGTEKFVRVIEAEEIREVQVQTGLRGSDGFWEILEGLKEGQTIITFLEE